MKKIAGFVIGIIIVFSIIHWSGIYTDNIEKAIAKNGWGKPLLTENINDDTAISLLKDKSKIRVIICKHGSLGWEVKGNSGALSFNSNTGFDGKNGMFKLKNETINYVVGIINDNKIKNITYKTKNNPNENLLNMYTAKDGARIFYTFTKKDLSGVSYIANLF